MYSGAACESLQKVRTIDDDWTLPSKPSIRPLKCNSRGYGGPPHSAWEAVSDVGRIVLPYTQDDPPPSPERNMSEKDAYWVRAENPENVHGIDYAAYRTYVLRC
jgi:hypothetical protein